MIGYLHGKIVYKCKDELIIDVNGVGYQVFVPENFSGSINLESDVKLHIYHHIRQDIMALYGFETREYVDFFKKLLNVSGIGPKSALNVLSMIGLDEIINAIISADPEVFTNVSGIGKKTAERLVLELKNQVAGFEGISSNIKIKNNLHNSSEVIDALVHLGYSHQQARKAIKDIPDNITEISDKITYALKTIN